MLMAHKYLLRQTDLNPMKPAFMRNAERAITNDSISMNAVSLCYL